MANIFNYKSKAAYEAATDRPTFQSSLSYDGDEAHVDGVNILLPFRESNCEVGDMVVYDSVEKCHKVLKWQSYNAGTFDSSRYIMSKGLYVGTYGNKAHFCAYENAGSGKWAESCYFRLTGFNLAAAGSITFKTYYAWVSHADNVASWGAGATLADVAAAINNLGLSASYFKAAVLADATGIGIWVDYPTTANVANIFSITTQTGSVAVEYCNKMGDADVVFQYVDTSTIIDGRIGPKNVIRRNGLSTSYGGAHFERFKQYYAANGSTKFEAETSASVMSQAMFESLASATDETQKALYDKYNGDYAAYIKGRMVAEESGRGVMAASYINYVEQTALLAKVMTQDYDRNVIPAFPAAYKAYHYGVNSAFDAGFDAGKWGLPSAYLMVKTIKQVGLNSSNKTTFNKAFDKFNSSGNIYASGGYYWTSAEYSANYAFRCNGYHGSLNGDYRCYVGSVRPLLALTFDS